MYTPKILCSIVIISLLLPLATVPSLSTGDNQEIMDLEEFFELMKFDMGSIPKANIPSDYKLLSYNPSTKKYELPYIYWETIVIEDEDFIRSYIGMSVTNKTRVDYHYFNTSYNGVIYGVQTHLNYKYKIEAGGITLEKLNLTSWEEEKDFMKTYVETKYDKFVDEGMYYILVRVQGDYYEPGIEDSTGDVVVDYVLEINAKGYLYPVTVKYEDRIYRDIAIEVGVRIVYDIEYTIVLINPKEPGGNLKEFINAVLSYDPRTPEDLDVVLSDYIDSIYSIVVPWIEDYFEKIGVGKYSGIGGGESYISITGIQTYGSGTEYSIYVDVDYALSTDHYSGRIVFSFTANGYNINDYVGCNNGLCYIDLVKEPKGVNEESFKGSLTYSVEVDFSKIDVDLGSQINLTVTAYLYGYNEPCQENCYSKEYLVAYDVSSILLSPSRRSYINIVEADPSTSTPLKLGKQNIKLYLDIYVDNNDLRGDLPYIVIEAQTDYGVIYSSEPELIEPDKTYSKYMAKIDFTITEADLGGSNKLYIYAYIIDSSGKTIVRDSIMYNIGGVSGAINFYIDYDASVYTGEVFTDKLTGWTPIKFSYTILVEHISSGGVLDSWSLVLPSSGSIPIDYLTNSSIPYNDGDYIHIVIENRVDPKTTIYRGGYIKDIYDYKEIYGSNKYFPTAHLYLKVVSDGYGGISDLILGNGVWDPCSKNVWVRIPGSEWFYVSPYSDRKDVSVYNGFDIKVRTVIAWERMLKHIMISFLKEVSTVSPTVIDRVRNIDIWYGQKGTEYSPEGYIYREYISFEVSADRLYDPTIYRDTSGEIMPVATFFHELGHLIKEHMFPDNIELGGSHGIADESNEYVAYDEAHSHFISILVRDYAYGRGFIEKGFAPSFGDTYFREPYLQEALFKATFGERVEGCVAAVLLHLLYNDHYTSPKEAVEAYSTFIKASTLYKYYNGHPPRTILDFLTTLLALMPLHNSKAGQYPYSYYDDLIDLSIRYSLPIRIYPLNNLKKADSFLVIVYPMDQVSVSYNGSVHKFLNEPFVVFTYDNLTLNYEGKATTILVDGTGLVNQKLSSIISGGLYKNIHSEIITYGKTEIVFKGNSMEVYGYTGYTKAYIKTSKISKWFNSTGSSLLLRLFNKHRKTYLGTIDIGCDIVLEFNEDLEVYILEGEVTLNTQDYKGAIKEGYMFKIGDVGVDVIEREYNGTPWDYIPPLLYSWNIDKLYAMPNDLIEVFVKAIDKSGLESIELIIEGKGVNETYYPSTFDNGKAVFDIQLPDTGAYMVYIRLVDNAGNSVVYKLTTLVITSIENNSIMYTEEGGEEESIENIGIEDLFKNAGGSTLYFIIIIVILSIIAVVIAIVIIYAMSRERRF